MTPNDKLPEEITDQINNEADKYGFVVPYDGSNKFYNDDNVKGYQAGATAWAPWKVKYNEAKKLLDEVFRKHESGLLPDRFIYEKIKTFLNEE